MCYMNNKCQQLEQRHSTMVNKTALMDKKSPVAEVFEGVKLYLSLIICSSDRIQ